MLLPLFRVPSIVSDIRLKVADDRHHINRLDAINSQISADQNAATGNKSLGL